MIDVEEARYERKFLVSGVPYEYVRNVVRLNPAFFRQTYAPRWVNNIYLDSTELRSFTDTIEGVRDRGKIRIRWYGDALGVMGQPVLEVKKKRGFVVMKNRFELPPWEMGGRFDVEAIRDLLGRADVPPGLRESLQGQRPTLFNRYFRSYAESDSGIYRISLDKSLGFERIDDGSRVGLGVRSDAIILELKYNVENDDRAHHITQGFPFRMTKSSKYAIGVQLTSA